MLSCFWLFADPWTVAHQAPLSTGFPMQEYWSGLPFPSPGDLPDPRIKPESLNLLHWQVGSSPLVSLGKPKVVIFVVQSLSHAQLCNPMDCSTPGFLVLHHLPGIAIEVSNFNSVFVFVFFWPQGMCLSSCTRDRTHTSCTGSTES